VTLKGIVTQTLVLALPDFSKPFVLETNALGMRIGAILSSDILYRAVKTGNSA